MAIGGCGAERFFQRLRFFVVVQGGFVFFDDFLFDVLGADDGYFFAEGHEKVVDPVGFGQCQVNGVSALCLGDGAVFQQVIQFEADFRGETVIPD